MATLLDLFLHLDEQLSWLIGHYGVWTYAIVALVVFCETGLVVTPFLPGDSLLFALGALAARGDLQLGWMMAILFVAVLLGDNVNYWLGRRLGPALFSGKSIRWLNQSHLHETQEFYKRHGGKTVIMARFVPIVRTFAPFVAGIGAMSYGKFFAYSLAGSISWIGIACGAGYFFGNIPVVQQNFEFVVIGIVVISLLPAVIKFMQKRRRSLRVDTDIAN